MNKKELLNIVNAKSGITKKDCKLCLDTLLDIIKNVMQNGDSLTLSNFGKFKVSEIKSKSMYNFKTHRSEMVASRKVPTFKASENLRQIVK